jgi:hypothetical protein
MRGEGRDPRFSGRADSDQIHRRLFAYIAHLLDTKVFQIAKPLKILALPSGIEPLSPP